MCRPVTLLNFLLCAIVVAGGAFAQTPAHKQIVPLDSGWEFRQLTESPDSATTTWRPAQVPGDVHLDLLRNHLIPDPFYRDNEAKLQWIEDASWEYRTAVQASPALLEHKNIELVFEGLDAYAEVYLNDKLILTADNMFREWRVNVKPVLRSGANQLRVVFPSPIQAAAKWRRPINGDCSRRRRKKLTFAKRPTNMDGTGDRASLPAGFGGLRS